MNKSIQRKAKYISSLIEEFPVYIADFGSEDVNWDESLHVLLEKEIGKKIVRVDKFGSPDIKVDFDKSFAEYFKHKYGIIICSEVIEHLKRPYDFLLECKEVLDDEGKIILTTPNASSLAEISNQFKKNNHNKEYGEHLYCWNRTDMENLIRSAGYEIEEFKYISYYWNKNVLFKFLAWMLPVLRPNLLFVIKRSSPQI